MPKSYPFLCEQLSLLNGTLGLRIHVVIPTRSCLAGRIGLNENKCMSCDQEEETADHLFCNCNVIRAIAFGSKWGLKWESLQCNDVKSLIATVLKPNALIAYRRLENEDATLILVSVMYSAWHFRNKNLFEGKQDIKAAVRHFENVVEDFITSRMVEKTEIATEEEAIGWPTPPAEDWLVANTDVAINSTETALALVVRDCRGKLIFMASKITTRLAAIDAEMKAIDWASDLAMERGWRNLKWYTHSLSSAKLINSRSDDLSWNFVDEVLNIRRKFAKMN